MSIRAKKLTKAFILNQNKSLLLPRFLQAKISVFCLLKSTQTPFIQSPPWENNFVTFRDMTEKTLDPPPCFLPPPHFLHGEEKYSMISVVFLFFFIHILPISHF